MDVFIYLFWSTMDVKLTLIHEEWKLRIMWEPQSHQLATGGWSIAIRVVSLGIIHCWVSHMDFLAHSSS